MVDLGGVTASVESAVRSSHGFAGTSPHYDGPLRVAWMLGSQNGFDFVFLYALFCVPLQSLSSGISFC